MILCGAGVYIKIEAQTCAYVICPFVRDGGVLKRAPSNPTCVLVCQIFC